MEFCGIEKLHSEASWNALCCINQDVKYVLALGFFVLDADIWDDGLAK